MRQADFEAMVVGMAGEVPREFLDGVAEITVSSRAVPHPDRPGIFTLGECIPLPAGDSGGVEGIQSRIVLYHGSFLALARVTPGFDWREDEHAAGHARHARAPCRNRPARTRASVDARSGGVRRGVHRAFHGE